MEQSDGTSANVTVLQSCVAVSPTGEVAIVLDTSEVGKIVFAATLETCAALRREIAAAETFLRRGVGTA